MKVFFINKTKIHATFLTSFSLKVNKLVSSYTNDRVGTMDLDVGVPELLRLGRNLVGHKVVQTRLAAGETRVLETKYGKIRGLQRRTVYDSIPYYAFEGIPFAKPPLGELRFRAPVPAEPWEGIRDCTYYRDKPYQRHFIVRIVEGSEDCLYLNVYVKSFDTKKPLPVMVWIFGGGFYIGEASRDNYSPDYFMQKDIVFVAITYRLGSLGFLSLKDQELDIPGNAGLKDVVLGLRWVKENIATFNGDPDNITLFGESAGAVITHIMMLTEQTRGLFHKAIVQSGSALCNWTSPPDHNWGYRLARHLGYKGPNNDKSVYKYLLHAKARRIANKDGFITKKSEQRDYQIFAFTPVVEPYITDHCVVPKPYIEMLPDAWSNKIPLIIGGNSFEGLFSFQKTEKYFLTSFEPIIPPCVRRVSTKEEIAEMVTRLKKVHFRDPNYTKMHFYECLRMGNIKHFWHDIHRTVLARMAYAREAPTYMYRFDFDSPHFNHFRILNCGRRVRGVCHADDISYLFYNILSNKVKKTSDEYKTIVRMIGMWTSFAITSDPNCNEIKPVVWEPVKPVETGDTHSCLNISNTLEYIKLPERELFELWDSFYTKAKLY